MKRKNKKEKKEEQNTSRETKRQNICVISRDQHVLSFGFNQWKKTWHTYTQAKTFTMCHKKRKKKKTKNEKRKSYMNMRINACRTEKQKQRKEKKKIWVALHIHKRSTVNTTIKSFHLYPTSQMFLLSIWTKFWVYIYINISYRNNSSFGGKWSFFFFFRKIKWHSFSLLFPHSKKKWSQSNIYEKKQTYTQRQWSIHITTKKKNKMTSEITWGKRKANTGWLSVHKWKIDISMTIKW